MRRLMTHLPCLHPPYTNRRASVHKKLQLTPSLRFPLRAGGTEPLRGSPCEQGEPNPCAVPLAKRGEP
jgi:hypothetical protein